MSNGVDSRLGNLIDELTNTTVFASKTPYEKEIEANEIGKILTNALSGLNEESKDIIIKDLRAALSIDKAGFFDQNGSLNTAGLERTVKGVVNNSINNIKSEGFDPRTNTNNSQQTTIPFDELAAIAVVNKFLAEKNNMSKSEFDDFINNTYKKLPVEARRKVFNEVYEDYKNSVNESKNLNQDQKDKLIQDAAEENKNVSNLDKIIEQVKKDGYDSLTDDQKKIIEIARNSNCGANYEPKDVNDPGYLDAILLDLESGTVTSRDTKRRVIELEDKDASYRILNVIMNGSIDELTDVDRKILEDAGIDVKDIEEAIQDRIAHEEMQAVRKDSEKTRETESADKNNPISHSDKVVNEALNSSLTTYRTNYTDKDLDIDLNATIIYDLDKKNLLKGTSLNSFIEFVTVTMEQSDYQYYIDEQMNTYDIVSDLLILSEENGIFLSDKDRLVLNELYSEQNSGAFKTILLDEAKRKEFFKALGDKIAERQVTDIEVENGVKSGRLHEGDMDTKAIEEFETMQAAHQVEEAKPIETINHKSSDTYINVPKKQFEKENSEGPINIKVNAEDKEPKANDPEEKKEQVSFFGKVKSFFKNMKYMKETDPNKGFFERLTDSYKAAFGSTENALPEANELPQRSTTFDEQIKVNVNPLEAVQQTEEQSLAKKTKDDKAKDSSNEGPTM